MHCMHPSAAAAEAEAGAGAPGTRALEKIINSPCAPNAPHQQHIDRSHRYQNHKMYVYYHTGIYYHIFISFIYRKCLCVCVCECLSTYVGCNSVRPLPERSLTHPPSTRRRRGPPEPPSAPPCSSSCRASCTTITSPCCKIPARWYHRERRRRRRGASTLSCPATAGKCMRRPALKAHPC
eukprot:COSAG01_NODE_2142_length_8319_cov_19.391653_3_plen_180_part_00